MKKMFWLLLVLWETSASAVEYDCLTLLTYQDFVVLPETKINRATLGSKAIFERGDLPLPVYSHYVEELSRLRIVEAYFTFLTYLTAWLEQAYPDSKPALLKNLVLFSYLNRPEDDTCRGGTFGRVPLLASSLAPSFPTIRTLHRVYEAEMRRREGVPRSVENSLLLCLQRAFNRWFQTFDTNGPASQRFAEAFSNSATFRSHLDEDRLEPLQIFQEVHPPGGSDPIKAKVINLSYGKPFRSLFVNFNGVSRLYLYHFKTIADDQWEALVDISASRHSVRKSQVILAGALILDDDLFEGVRLNALAFKAQLQFFADIFSMDF